MVPAVRRRHGGVRGRAGGDAATAIRRGRSRSAGATGSFDRGNRVGRHTRRGTRAAAHAVREVGCRPDRPRRTRRPVPVRGRLLSRGRGGGVRPAAPRSARGDRRHRSACRTCPDVSGRQVVGVGDLGLAGGAARDRGDGRIAGRHGRGDDDDPTPHEGPRPCRPVGIRDRTAHRRHVRVGAGGRSVRRSPGSGSRRSRSVHSSWVPGRLPR